MGMPYNREVLQPYILELNMDIGKCVRGVGLSISIVNGPVVIVVGS